MFSTNFLTETEVRKVISYSQKYHLVEYTKDMSVDRSNAMTEYFSGQMNLRKRQLAVKLSNDEVIIQAGAMQWYAGDVEMKTDVKGVGDLTKKLFGASVTGETAIKPKYIGTGYVVLEPTYKHLLFEDVGSWGEAGLVIQDGLFLACDSSVNMKVVHRKNLSSAALGGEGLFNTCLSGFGTVILESKVPSAELVLVNLDNDTIKIDGSFAIAWSGSLDFTVEKTAKSLVGSAASGEGLVNVYRGTGKILMAVV